MCNYTDGTSFDSCDLDPLWSRSHENESVLEYESVLTMEWFEGNIMKLSRDKYQGRESI